MADISLPTAEQLRQLLTYNPETGVFVWLPRTASSYISFSGTKVNTTLAAKFNEKKAGRRADRSASGGYRSITIFRRTIGAHRIAWCMVHGNWPEGVIDHINGQPDDNRIANLRDVDEVANQRNRRYNPRAASGVTGVYWNKASGKWQARLYLKDGALDFGLYQTVDEAAFVIGIARKALGFADRHR